MARFTMTHEFDCSADTFWDKVMFDKDMNDQLFRKALAFPEYQLVEQRESETEIFRKTVATPKMDLPAAVQKVLGSNFRYTEETRFDKKTRRCTFKGIPSTMADKMTNEGTIRVEPVSDRRCRRTVEVTMEARIMFVGGLMESTGEKNIRDAYDKGAVFINKWIAEHKL